MFIDLRRTNSHSNQSTVDNTAWTGWTHFVGESRVWYGNHRLQSCRTTHFEQLNQSFRVYLPFIPIPMGSHHVPHSFMAIFNQIWPRQGHGPTEHKALADSRPKCGNIAVKPAQSFPRKIPDGQRRPSSSCPDSFLLCQF